MNSCHILAGFVNPGVSLLAYEEFCITFASNTIFLHLIYRFITARVRSTREDNIYTWECLSVHIAGGGGVPCPRSWGGTTSQVWLGGGTPSQVWLGGTHLRSGDWGYLGYPPRPGMGYPPDQVWMRYSPWTLDRVPSPQTWDGVPPPTWDGPPPDLGRGTSPPPLHHSEHLIRGGRYASCVHAGGLSC